MSGRHHAAEGRPSPDDIRREVESDERLVQLFEAAKSSGTLAVGGTIETAPDQS